ncbi:MAG: beta-ketoacyl-ACP synthase III [Planctomycetota bacterium]|nr:beta-ketoacyl-ACP synthase III [Planctomycetota bacterium]
MTQMPNARSSIARSPGRTRGVKIAGTGSALPSKIITNADLERLMDTSDEWIVQRTGIRQRHVIDPSKGESMGSLAASALITALNDARMRPEELDFIIIATMTSHMACPPTACQIAFDVGQRMGGAVHCGAMDLSGACSGFVYGMNIAHDLIMGGAYRSVALVGADTISELMDYATSGRTTAIIFGDAAGAAIFRATDDPNLGILAQTMRSDGSGWKEIYVPRDEHDFPAKVAPEPEKIGRVQMNGASVFKFAVGTFPEIIQETLDAAKLKPDDIDVYVCHQSNQRILHAARDRFGLAPDKLYVNIDRVGNTVAASVPLCLDELRRAGRVKDGSRVMFVAFGGGLTWGTSLWQL